MAVMRPRTLSSTVVVLIVIALAAGLVAAARGDIALDRAALGAGQPPPATTATSSPEAAATGDRSPVSTLATPAGDGPEMRAGDLTDGCLTGAAHAATGAIQVVPGESAPSSGGRPIRYIVETEAGLAVDGACFAQVVHDILSDERSWGGGDRLSLQRVDEEPVDFRVALMSPALTDSECAPLDTTGIYSCWTGTRAAINVWRWEHGTSEFADALPVYREYLINHEVGHALDRGHAQCPGAGEPAPIMQQQTKGLNGCLPNGYPLEAER